MNLVNRGFRVTDPYVKKLLAIVSVGIVLRLIWVAMVWNMGFGSSTDQSAYVDTGYQLAGLRPMTGLVYSPLYPHFLGGVIKVLDVLWLDFLPLRGVVGVIQAFIAGGVIFLIGLLGRRRISASSGLFAAAILAVWPDQVMATGTLLTERLSTPFAVLGLVLLLWNKKDVSKKLLLFSGMAFGLAFLGRFALAPLILFAVAVAFLKGSGMKQRFELGLRVAVGGLIVITPWLGYTYLITGQPLVFSAGGGFNLCIGNNDYATGGWSSEAVEKVCPWPSGRQEQVAMDVEQRRKALEWMLENPDKQWDLVKARYDQIFLYDSGSLAWYPTYMKWEGPVDEETVWEVSNKWWFNIAPLSLLGIFALRRRLRFELLAYAFASALLPMISIGEMRMKDALIPVMALSVGALLGWFVDQFMKSKDEYERRVEIFSSLREERTDVPE